MSSLESWTLGSHSAGGISHPTYRKGSGPGVIVIHEIPGITPAVLQFGEDVVARGFTVVMPSLFGRAGSEATVLETVRSIAVVCVGREFTMFALERTTPVATWLQSLARELHRELGGPGVGAVGMCLTGGWLRPGDARRCARGGAGTRSAGLARPGGQGAPSRPRAQPHDLESIKAKVQAGCQVLGLRYEGDPAVGTRFDTLRRELGDNFIAVEFPGRKHATLTEHRQQAGVRVLAYFDEKLKTPTESAP
jgi:dienelactone hydrolase